MKKMIFADVEFAMRRLMDGEKRLSIWGESLIKAYAQVSILKFAPPIAWANQKDYLVFGSRIFNKFSDDGRKNSHVILSVRDPFRLARIPSSFSYDLKSYNQIICAARSKKNVELVELQNRMLRVIEKTRAKIFVANSTIDPINRLWLNMARQVGLKTICLQHGVYGTALPDYALEEDIVDQYIALDDSQASIVARCIPPVKIILLGKRSSFEWIPPEKELKICFVGEDWERYGFSNLKSVLIDCYRTLAKSLRRKKGIVFCYKPHPSEKFFYGIDKEMPLLSQKNIDEPHVYIGFSSSLLRDMAAQGKLSIQIVDSRFNSDIFSENGYCISFHNDRNLVDSILDAVRLPKNVPCIAEARLEDILH